MQIATLKQLLDVEPGTTVDVVVDVVNTSELIDGVSARLIGLPEATVVCEPQMLPLFPEASGQVRVSITVPSTTPAGVHPLSIEIHSHAGTGTQHLDVDLSVAAHPDIRVQADPPRVRARRSAQFLLDVQNTGNTALAVTLGSEREDRRTQVTFMPEEFTAEAGSSTPVIVRVKGPRMFTGTEAERRVGVDLRARRIHVIPAMLETEPEPELRSSTTITLRQRPLIGRGVLTALILLSIVALWAIAFLLGLTQVFSGDALTKTAPTTFPTTSVGQAAGGSPGSDGSGSDGSAAPQEGDVVPGAAPPGALPKTGIVPAKVGGSIQGTVTAATDGAPVGRIMVRVYRQGRDGLVQVSSAASQSDGSYTVAGLFPTDYRLRFSAKGFDTVWYPSGGSQARATVVPVNPQTATNGINIVVQGQTATISGTIDAGDAVTPPITTVTARMVASGAPATPPTPQTTATPATAGTQTSAASGIRPAAFVRTPGTTQAAALPAVLPTVDPPRPAATTTSDASGAYTLTGLASPATYELSFTAPGYQVTKVLTKVGGGETRLQPTIVPGSTSGSIQGTVLSQGVPLGNVQVSTTVAGEQVTVATPTVGQVGAFNLGNLPTPGTYVLTFTAENQGSVSRIVDLGAGDTRSGLRVDLAAGTGTVTGKVTSADGIGLGGVTVTVGGDSSTEATAAPSTTSLTSGDVGAYRLNGLAAGEYTLTFTLAGHSPATVPVSVDGSGAVTGVDVVLGTQLGTISGTVRGPLGTAYVGATLTITNGRSTWTATSTAAGGSLAAGGYLVGGLEPGTYSVTVSADGLRQQTAMVTVYAGINSIQKLQLRSS